LKSTNGSRHKPSTINEKTLRIALGVFLFIQNTSDYQSLASAGVIADCDRDNEECDKFFQYIKKWIQI
jgi:hypothetical protein